MLASQGYWFNSIDSVSKLEWHVLNIEEYKGYVVSLSCPSYSCCNLENVRQKLPRKKWEIWEYGVKENPGKFSLSKQGLIYLFVCIYLGE